MKKQTLLASMACVLLLACNARAIEGGAGHYISAQYVDFSGMPPTQSGFYVGSYFLDYDDGTFSGGKELPLGGIFAAGVTANTQAVAPLGIYAYPFSLHGVTFSSGIAIPFGWVDVKASASFDRNNLQLSGAKEQSVSGLGDIQLMPIMAGWTNGDFKLGGLFNIWAPSGEYDSGRLANQGLGYWTFSPVLAFSWLSSTIGTEFTVFSGVDFNTSNGTTDYQSGDIFHVDGTLAQHLPLFGGIAGAGVSAFYLKQFTGDSGSGARLGGFLAKSYGIGPTLTYVHPIGSSTLVVSGSWLPQTFSENTTKGSYFWVRAVLQF